MQRREVLAYSGVVAAAVAGCLGDSDEDEPSGGDNASDDDSDDDTGGNDDQSGGAYSVSMAPVGEITLESVPERWETYFPGYADMGVALGRGDGLAAIGEKWRYHTDAYDELGAVELDTEGLTEIWSDGIDKEIYYELDCDIHLTDPRWLVNNSAFGLEEADVDELAESVAPFFGNTIFRRTDEWHDYEYYTLYEAFEKVAEVFRETERYEAFAELHDEYVGRVQDELPDERPNALLTFADGDEPEEFYPYRVDDEGTNTKQFRDLGVEDALAETGVEGLSTSDRGTIDYETMLQVDPDVILVRGHEDKSAEEFEQTVLATMKDDGVASDLRAVQNDRVFRGGPIYQGPIQHLFTLERAATELFPDTFSDELFDRDRVSSIVAGDF
ncbi:ABC transporter substrate-binding protein [Haloferacaceae archaeon DSL9]